MNPTYVYKIYIYIYIYILQHHLEDEEAWKEITHCWKLTLFKLVNIEREFFTFYTKGCQVKLGKFGLLHGGRLKCI
jgi:hypothetical protein